GDAVRLFHHKLYSADNRVGAGAVLVVFAICAISSAPDLPPELSVTGRSVRLLDMARVGSAAKGRQCIRASRSFAD
ncbi:hypothetical protein LTR46_011992, partial [Exophiala xenobiotica]